MYPSHSMTSYAGILLSLLLCSQVTFGAAIDSDALEAREPKHHDEPALLWSRDAAPAPTQPVHRGGKAITTVVETRVRLTLIESTNRAGHTVTSTEWPTPSETAKSYWTTITTEGAKGKEITEAVEMSRSTITKDGTPKVTYVPESTRSIGHGHEGGQHTGKSYWSTTVVKTGGKEVTEKIEYSKTFEDGQSTYVPVKTSTVGGG